MRERERERGQRNGGCPSPVQSSPVASYRSTTTSGLVEAVLWWGGSGDDQYTTQHYIMLDTPGTLANNSSNKFPEWATWGD